MSEISLKTCKVPSDPCYVFYLLTGFFGNKTENKDKEKIDNGHWLNTYSPVCIQKYRTKISNINEKEIWKAGCPQEEYIFSCGKKDSRVQIASKREDCKLVLLLDLRACIQGYNKRKSQLCIAIFLLVHCYWEKRIERTRQHTLEAR